MGNNEMVKKQTFIDNQLAEVHDYIIDKILALDVNRVKINIDELTFLIDNKHEVSIYIAAGVKGCTIQSLDGRYFDRFPIPMKVKKKIWAKIKPFRHNAAVKMVNLVNGD